MNYDTLYNRKLFWKKLLRLRCIWWYIKEWILISNSHCLSVYLKPSLFQYFITIIHHQQPKDEAKKIALEWLLHRRKALLGDALPPSQPVSTILCWWQLQQAHMYQAHMNKKHPVGRGCLFSCINMSVMHCKKSWKLRLASDLPRRRMTTHLPRTPLPLESVDLV